MKPSYSFDSHTSWKWSGVHEKLCSKYPVEILSRVDNKNLGNGGSSEAEQGVQWKSKSLIAYLKSFLQNLCDPRRKEKASLNMDLEKLINNDVNKFVFADSIRELVRKGRGKNPNLIITGSSIRGKTLILNIFDTTFDTFTNPSTDKRVFVCVENKDLMLLNNLQWPPGIISWFNFSNLLKRQTIHLAAAKAYFAQNIILSGDKSIFATSIKIAQFEGKRDHMQVKNAMTAARWKEVKIKAPITIKNQKKIKKLCKLLFKTYFHLCRDLKEIEIVIFSFFKLVTHG